MVSFASEYKNNLIDLCLHKLVYFYQVFVTYIIVKWIFMLSI